MLDVPESVLHEHGAVSRPVVETMTAALQQKWGVDCAIATSGIAGPDGGTPDKPVGTVWIAVRLRDEMVVECGEFKGSRSYVIERATQRALLLLIGLLVDNRS